MQAYYLTGGIDLGGRKSGSTSLCILKDNQICFFNSETNTDSHDWIFNLTIELKLKYLFLDAPLSLPGVYHNLNAFTNYHFRKADLELSAMSPMFLGGFTASAMELAAQWKRVGLCVHETYPAALVRHMNLNHLYRKTEKAAKLAPQLIQAIKKNVLWKDLNFSFSIRFPPIRSWHEVDAFLCLLSGIRYQTNRALCYGDPAEGLIWI